MISAMNTEHCCPSETPSGAVNHAALLKTNVLCVLAADLEDCVHARVVVAGARSVRRNLILDEDRFGPIAFRQQRPDDLASAAGDAGAADGLTAHGAFEELPPQRLCCLDRSEEPTAE